MFMLDTDTCSYILREKPRTVAERLREHAGAGIAISEIVHAELRYGAVRHPERRETLERLIAAFVSRLQVLPWRASAHYGRLRAGLEAAGTPIGAMDMLVAAHALERDAVLVTNNVRHFSRVEGLELQNWA